MNPLKCSFVALEVSLELAESLGPALTVLKSKNKELADQAKRALQSVGLNLAEGSRSQGGNRSRSFWVASGSLEETVAALRMAHAFGEIERTTLTRVEPLVDRLRGLIWGLTHPSDDAPKAEAP